MANDSLMLLSRIPERIFDLVGDNKVIKLMSPYGSSTWLNLVIGLAGTSSGLQKEQP